MFALQKDCSWHCYRLTLFQVAHVFKQTQAWKLPFPQLLRTAEGRLAPLGGPALPPSLHTVSNTRATFLTGVTTGSVLSH